MGLAEANGLRPHTSLTQRLRISDRSHSVASSAGLSSGRNANPARVVGIHRHLHSMHLVSTEHLQRDDVFGGLGKGAENAEGMTVAEDDENRSAERGGFGGQHLSEVLETGVANAGLVTHSLKSHSKISAWIASITVSTSAAFGSLEAVSEPSDLGRLAPRTPTPRPDRGPRDVVGADHMNRDELYRRTRSARSQESRRRCRQ